MQTFRFQSTSFLHYTLILIAGICLVSLLVVDIKPNEQSAAVVFFTLAIPMIFIGLFADRNSKQVVSLSINSSYLDVSWLKLPLYVKRENKLIPWAQIKDYFYHPDKEQNKFEIVLKNADKITFFISNNKVQKEEFDKFYVALISRVHNFNEEEKASVEETLSTKPESFYETKFAFAIAVLLVVCSLVFLIYTLNKPVDQIVWRPLCVVLSLTIFYVELIWQYNRKSVTHTNKEYR